MLYEVSEVEVGQTVFLFPHTKGASVACQEQRVVEVMTDPKKHWPYVLVEWAVDGVKHWEKVHRDNIKKKQQTETATSTKQQGDQVGGGKVDGKWQRRVFIAPPVENIEGQDVLF